MADTTTQQDIIALINYNFEGVRVEVSREGLVQIGMTPRGRHQLIAAKIHNWLVGATADVHAEHVIDGLGVDAAGALRVPDVAVIVGAIDGDVVYQRAELFCLIIEIISPSTGTIDLGEKMADYARAGIEHYWIVAEDDTVGMFRLIDGKYVANGGPRLLSTLMRNGDVGGLVL